MKQASAGSAIALDLDRDSDVPLYRQIIERLREAVRRGRLPSGSRLPSTRALASDWAVSRNTVLQVFETLVSEGVLESRVGDGTYVAGPGATAAPAVAPETAAEPIAYPFRNLSRRGRALVAQSPGGFSERPTPFMPDVPDVRAFPIRSWLRLMNEVSGRLTGEILVKVSNAGYGPLREAIAHHLAVTRDVTCSPEQIIVTTGSQQSYDLIARVLCDRGDPVWMEEPGYIGARAAMTANGCVVYPVPADADGMNIEAALSRFPTPRLIVVTAARHYPLGGTLSADRRNALARLSRKAGSWILEDGYDSEFRYAGSDLPALIAGDRDGRTFLVGTFSKTLLPTFRLGYLVVPPDLAAAFARAREVVDRHAPLLEQMVLAEFMHRGYFAAHVRRMRALYRERQQVMVGLLREVLDHVPPDHECQGGMHLVLPLRAGVDDREVVADLWRHGLVTRPLSTYYAGRQVNPGLLIGFAAFTEEEIGRVGVQMRVLSSLVDRSARAGTTPGPRPAASG